MAKNFSRRLEQRRTQYEPQIGAEAAAIVESDTAVMTTRMSERERSIAQRYREVVRQLASC